MSCVFSAPHRHRHSAHTYTYTHTQTHTLRPATVKKIKRTSLKCMQEPERKLDLAERKNPVYVRFVLIYSIVFYTESMKNLYISIFDGLLSCNLWISCVWMEIFLNSLVSYDARCLYFCSVQYISVPCLCCSFFMFFFRTLSSFSCNTFSSQLIRYWRSFDTHLSFKCTRSAFYTVCGKSGWKAFLTWGSSLVMLRHKCTWLRLGKDRWCSDGTERLCLNKIYWQYKSQSSA